MSKELLFEISPIEDEDSKKKKASKRSKKQDEPAPREPVDYSSPRQQYFIATLDVACERCGCSITDLAEIVRDEWHVVCGWGCGRQFVIDPIPGILEEKKTGSDYVLKSGRFAGKTFDEIVSSGESWYIESLIKLGKKTVESRAAAEWMNRKSVDARQ